MTWNLSDFINFLFVNVLGSKSCVHSSLLVQLVNMMWKVRLLVEDIRVGGSHSRKTMPQYPCVRVSCGVHGCFIVIDPEMPTKLLSSSFPLGLTLASQRFMFGSHAHYKASSMSEDLSTRDRMTRVGSRRQGDPSSLTWPNVSLHAGWLVKRLNGASTLGN